MIVFPAHIYRWWPANDILGGDADIPALLSYAQLMELSEPLVAIDAYTKALKALKDSSAIEPLELLNNVAALQARNYEYTDAKATLRRWESSS